MRTVPICLGISIPVPPLTSTSLSAAEEEHPGSALSEQIVCSRTMGFAEQVLHGWWKYLGRAALLVLSLLLIWGVGWTKMSSGFTLRRRGRQRRSVGTDQVTAYEKYFHVQV